jgi:hypothetical protein
VQLDVKTLNFINSSLRKVVCKHTIILSEDEELSSGVDLMVGCVRLKTPYHLSDSGASL